MKKKVGFNDSTCTEGILINMLTSNSIIKCKCMLVKDVEVAIMLPYFHINSLY